MNNQYKDHEDGAPSSRQHAALCDAFASLIRWCEACPDKWDERDDRTLENIRAAIKTTT